MSDYDSGDDEEYSYMSDGDEVIEDGMSLVEKATHHEYQVVDLGVLQAQQTHTIAETSDMLQVSKDVAILLLRRNGWSKDIVQDRYYAAESPLAFLQKQGVALVDKLQLGAKNDLDCGVCGDTVNCTNVAIMGCGHGYCADCWAGYLQAKVEEGPCCLLTTCLAYKCDEAVPDTMFRAVLEGPSLEQYTKWHLRSFVDQNGSITWCPSPNCGNAIRGDGGECFASCACGFQLCLRCGQEAHPGVHCGLLRAWTEKCAGESENARWVVAHTKQCPNPKCSVRIEKNQGCNHMTCKSCHHHFCWVCMGPWKAHGGDAYSCNSYKDEPATVKTARTELGRYLHYNERFLNHQKSEAICIRVRDDAKAQVDQLTDMMVVDFQNVQKALELLIECRRTLKYTYAFGYYMDEHGFHAKEKALFEFLQANLEANTEVLTGLTETPLDTMNVADVINYTAVTEKFLHGFLDGVENGLCG
ncbi:hypothetical protein DYB28_009957 [Aphanomyces astaci]|uniref:RBR-type E3 ubiquitin transferase n=1 Tax=Aphanomyces astaci TaxID=112090 RepID=A0A397BL30_APHAT|nr:hypothetical protein DYB36_006136 [Aphanomyces astaci]RHY19988.1 hypothetical protein DYB25_004936 [Aphanomyces astaci]RHY53702.1 hypothetical protein DYB34_002279 [Aphanomyces astaci]RHY54269.1 hypothetical protein DYB38_004342 [Aphanomyces astaci]RHY55960.1 hypothetical protein DYB30_003199 [Aphanomyces astaci]